VTRNVRLLVISVAALAALAAMAAVAGGNHSAKDHVSIGPAGGNGVSDVFFDAVSADGSRVFFDTDEQLVAADTDANYDVYERHGGTTTLVSTGSTGGNGAFDVFFAAASADGTRVFFETDEQLTAADTDATFDVYERAGGTTTLSSIGTTGGNANADVTFHAISRQGLHVLFETDEQLTASDTDNQTDVFQRAGGTTTHVSTGPAGGNGPFFVAFGGVSADGARVLFETDEQLVAADTDSAFDVYERSGGTTALMSTGPAGGNANLDAGYRDISADGSHVFFQTSEALVAADTDAQSDLYDRSGGTTSLLSTGPAGGNGALAAAYEGTSADGTRVFLSTSEPLTAADTDTRRDIYARDGGTTELLSTGPAGGNGAFDADYMGASLDGSNAYIRTEEPLVAADTDTGCAGGQGPQCRDIYEYSGGTTTQVSLSATGGNGAFDASFATVSRDGERVFFDTREQLAASDTDASVDVYERFNGATTHISTGPAGGNGAFTAFLFSNGLSDDGTRAFFDTRETLTSSDTDTSFDLYVADVAGYPRPKAASPLQVSLVPAYSQCTAPNRTHGPPLAFPSCNPPAQASAQATVGSPDALGGGANFTGTVRYKVVVGAPGPPDDSNVGLTASLADVRCLPSGSSCGGANAAGTADYAGELRVSVGLQMTDRWNAPAAGGGTDAATVGEVTLAGSFPCGQTASTSTGSTCSLSTSANALVPGLVKDTKRAMWQFQRVQVHDGGPDLDADTTGDNTLFAVQGIFIP
jgi:Tol biopolymer transport system component